MTLTFIFIFLGLATIFISWALQETVNYPYTETDTAFQEGVTLLKSILGALLVADLLIVIMIIIAFTGKWADTFILHIGLFLLVAFTAGAIGTASGALGVISASPKYNFADPNNLITAPYQGLQFINLANLFMLLGIVGMIIFAVMTLRSEQLVFYGY